MANEAAVKEGVKVGLTWFYEMRFDAEESMSAACGAAVDAHEALVSPDIAALRELASSWEREVTGHYTGPQETEEATLKCVAELRALLESLPKRAEASKGVGREG